MLGETNRGQFYKARNECKDFFLRTVNATNLLENYQYHDMRYAALNVGYLPIPLVKEESPSLTVEHITPQAKPASPKEKRRISARKRVKQTVRHLPNVMKNSSQSLNDY